MICIARLPYADGRPLDPNDPAAMVARPPNAWEAMLRGLHGVVSFFSRISFLVDENTHAVHFFISALLQLLDRCAPVHNNPSPVSSFSQPFVTLVAYTCVPALGRRFSAHWHPPGQVGTC